MQTGSTKMVSRPGWLKSDVHRRAGARLRYVHLIFSFLFLHSSGFLRILDAVAKRVQSTSSVGETPADSTVAHRPETTAASDATPVLKRIDVGEWFRVHHDTMAEADQDWIIARMNKVFVPVTSHTATSYEVQMLFDTLSGPNEDEGRRVTFGADLRRVRSVGKWIPQIELVGKAGKMVWTGSQKMACETSLGTGGDYATVLWTDRNLAMREAAYNFRIQKSWSTNPLNQSDGSTLEQAMCHMLDVHFNPRKYVLDDDDLFSCSSDPTRRDHDDYFKHSEDWSYCVDVEIANAKLLQKLGIFASPWNFFSADNNVDLVNHDPNYAVELPRARKVYVRSVRKGRPEPLKFRFRPMDFETGIAAKQVVELQFFMPGYITPTFENLERRFNMVILDCEGLIEDELHREGVYFSAAFTALEPAVVAFLAKDDVLLQAGGPGRGGGERELLAPLSGTTDLLNPELILRVFGYEHTEGTTTTTTTTAGTVQGGRRTRAVGTTSSPVLRRPTTRRRYEDGRELVAPAAAAGFLAPTTRGDDSRSITEIVFRNEDALDLVAGKFYQLVRPLLIDLLKLSVYDLPRNAQGRAVLFEGPEGAFLFSGTEATLP
ncbi:unnamed protein product, partial [Amoebophrya sp. A120]|eukprot:GSA120T00014826001.1